MNLTWVWVIVIVLLLIGILIGWTLWMRKRRQAEQEEKKLRSSTKRSNSHVPIAADKVAESKVNPDLVNATIVANESLDLVDDNLCAVDGIDSDIESALKVKKITSFQDLAKLSDKEIDELETELNLEASRIRKENWTHQAAQKHFEKYGEEIYDQVNVDAVYQSAFDAQLAESKKGVALDYKDDLKLISGVGPKMEELLHSFGVTTFYHLSKLDKDGINALNEKLEFFPGRIERDDWVGQAKELYQKMHGTKL